jgi:hypothetical protein
MMARVAGHLPLLATVDRTIGSIRSLSRAVPADLDWVAVIACTRRSDQASTLRVVASDGSGPLVAFPETLDDDLELQATSPMAAWGAIVGLVRD